jgi:hypothetical protein
MQTTQLTRRTLWRQWFFATLIGFLVGGIVGMIAGTIGLHLLGALFIWMNFCRNDQSALACMFFGAILSGGIGLGLSIGTAQWFILKRIVRRAKWWILASALGWFGVALTLSGLFYTPIAVPVVQLDGTVLQTTLLDNLPYIIPAVAWLLGAGALMGIFQWLILRTSLRQAFWWIALHLVLMLLAALVDIFWIQGAGGLIGVAAFIVLSAPVYASMTATLLSWLVQSAS